MANKEFPKIGLALGSGGAKGFAHIGVIRTLEKYNIPIDYIAGSSIGSIIGAYYAAHGEISSLEDIILEFNRSKGLKLIDLTVKGGIMKGKKTEKFIQEMLGISTFSQTRIPFTAVSTDINTAESVIHHKGDITSAIRASISVPAFFQPTTVDKRLLADGGLSNPVPVDVVKNMGADITIAVNLDTVYTEKPFENFPALTRIPSHSINILRHNLAKQAVKTADIIIAPKDIFHIGLLGWNYFVDTDKVKQIIKAGEDAAEDNMPQLQNSIENYFKQQSGLQKFIGLFNRKR